MFRCFYLKYELNPHKLMDVNCARKPLVFFFRNEFMRLNGVKLRSGGGLGLVFARSR